MRSLAWHDWIWSPFMGSWPAAVAALLVILLGLTLVGAFFPGLSPGGLSRRERRWQTMPIRSWLRAGVLILGLLTLPAGVLLLFFPLPSSRPTILLLSSRARPPLGQDWKLYWADTTRNLPRDGQGQFADVGGEIDEICKRLNDRRPAGGWKDDDPNQVALIKQTVMEVLNSSEPSSHPRWIYSPDAVEHNRAPASLPPWLTESVEIAVVKVETRRHNVRQIVAMVSNRKTVGGNAWDDVESYWQTEWAQAPDIRVDRRPGSIPLTLVDVSINPAETHCDSIIVGVAYIDVAPKEPSEPANADLTLTLLGQQHASDLKDTPLDTKKLTISRNDARRIEQVPFTLKVHAGETPLRVCAMDPVPMMPRSGLLDRYCKEAMGRGTVVRLDVAPDAAAQARWEKTVEALQSNPAFEDWRNRLEKDFLLRVGNQLKVVFDSSATAPPPDCVIHAEKQRIWVCPGDYKNGLPSHLDSVFKTQLVRGRVTSGAVPGLYSLDALPLRSGSISIPDDGGAMILAELTVVPSRVDFGPAWIGEGPGGGRTALPFLFRTPAESTAGMASVTQLGLDPELQGMLLTETGAPPPNFELARFLSCWTAVFEAIPAAVNRLPATSDPNTSAGTGTSGGSPIALVNSLDLTLVTAEPLITGIVFLICGILFYAGIVLGGILAVPKFGAAL